ncbi:MAG: cysteine desulfurase [Clostridium sp.]|nr:cysteine desulfurase [Acetatifactor muris]MCM1527462.1 cysteine desulfurase [Bacteroides sp.]MCM1562092.1 cysteine desulfurase [Clostridium sp.]
MKKIYLDYAATTPLSPTTRQYLISLLDQYGNPSSLHSVGKPARQIITSCRDSVARFIHACPNDIFFTPGGAASNTLAVRGYCARHDCRILYSPTAHKSILKCVENRDRTYPLKVDRHGSIDLSNLREQLRASDEKALVAVEHACSEIGTIQDVRAIIDLTHHFNGIMYLDCTGSISSIPLDVEELNVDMCGFSAHKLGGLKGCGVFYKKPAIDPEPLICGSQEQGLIGGTENVLGIASLDRAVREHDYSSVSSHSRDYVCRYIADHIPESYLVGSASHRLPRHLYICFRGVEGESLMYLLDANGIQVSTGSACNSGALSASTALTAISMDPDDIHSCVRMTFSGKETPEELDYVCDKLNVCVAKLRKLNSKSNTLRKK